jgi:hypothetical protein
MSPHTLLVGMLSCAATLGEFGCSPKLSIKLPYDPPVSLLSYMPKRVENTCSHTHIHTHTPGKKQKLVHEY